MGAEAASSSSRGKRESFRQERVFPPVWRATNPAAPAPWLDLPGGGLGVSIGGTKPYFIEGGLVLDLNDLRDPFFSSDPKVVRYVRFDDFVFYISTDGYPETDSGFRPG